MSYTDPVLSQFKNKDSIDAKVISGLIEDARVQVQRSSGEGAYSVSGDLHERTLSKCKDALSIYTDLVKLSFLLAKSWDLKTLESTVLLRFGLQDIVTNEEISAVATRLKGKEGEDFERDIAMKTISKCDKLSVALEQLTLDSRDVMHFVKETTEKHDVSVLLSDAMSLLLEIWFLCGHQLRKLKRRVAAFFIRSKLLLIDYELELLSTTNMDKMTESNKETLRETILSYKSFIKVLLQQLGDAESADDQTEFEECLAIFMDVEGMYQAFNFSWLLRENTALLSDSEEQKQYAKAQAESDQHDLEELSGINEFVDTSLLQDDESDALDEEEKNNGLSDLPSTSNIATSSSGRSRRLSSMSGTSDISLMMEKTSLTKELPHLLQAFNNAKKLANDLENVRERGSATPPASSPIGSPSLSASTSMDASVNVLTNHVGINPTQIGSAGKILDTLAHRHQEFPFASSSPLTPSPLTKLEMSQQLIRQDMLKLMSQAPNSNKAPTTRPTNIPGFGSNILNNLYGIGSRP